MSANFLPRLRARLVPALLIPMALGVAAVGVLGTATAVPDGALRRTRADLAEMQVAVYVDAAATELIVARHFLQRNRSASPQRDAAAAHALADAWRRAVEHGNKARDACETEASLDLVRALGADARALRAEALAAGVELEEWRALQ